MDEFIVMFNSGFWEDTVCFNVKASSKQEALEIALGNNPEYSFWKNLIK